MATAPKGEAMPGEKQGKGKGIAGAQKRAAGPAQPDPAADAAVGSAADFAADLRLRRIRPDLPNALPAARRAAPPISWNARRAARRNRPSVPRRRRAPARQRSGNRKAARPQRQSRNPGRNPDQKTSQKTNRKISRKISRKAGKNPRHRPRRCQPRRCQPHRCQPGRRLHPAPILPPKPRARPRERCASIF